MNQKIAKLYIIAIAFVAALASCGSDDNGGGNNGGGNTTPNNTNANTVTANMPKEITRIEFPKVSGGDNNLVVVHKVSGFGKDANGKTDGVNYAIEWDCQKKAQRWTCYRMYAANSASNWKRDNWKSTSWGGDPFQEDTSIPAQYRTTLADYRGSGYDRGHICPSADRLYSKDVNEQTFYMSNMHPQINSFNTGVWATMENQLRAWNTNNFRDTLYVVKGGTIDTNKNQVSTYTKSGIIVPKYFFMAIVCKKGSNYKAIAFWAEHKESTSKEKLKPHMISVDELEQKTGIDFFCNLPDDIENRVEAVKPTEAVITAWGLDGK